MQRARGFSSLNTCPPIRDWVCGPGRALEIQDFCGISVLEGDHSDLLAAWLAQLDGHSGPRGIHGRFFGLDLSNPDAEMRTVIQKRMLQALSERPRLTPEVCSDLQRLPATVARLEAMGLAC